MAGQELDAPNVEIPPYQSYMFILPRYDFPISKPLYFSGPYMCTHQHFFRVQM